MRRTMPVRWIRALAISLCLVACVDAQTKTDVPQAFPWLNELELGDKVRDSGARLMAVAEGLYNIEQAATGAEETLQVGVHGWRSAGPVSYTHLTLPTKRIV